MKNKRTNFVKTILIFLGIIFFAFLFFELLIPRPKSYKSVEMQPQKIVYTAVGDSITHGIGDTNDNEGFVGALKDRLEQEKNVKVKSNNYGYTGETSSSVRKKIENNQKLRTSLKNADLITVEMGGNDIIYTIQKNFLKLEKKEFEPRAKDYQANLNASLKEIRKLNGKAKIVVLGIYNPFYLYFNQIKDLNQLFKEWNKITIESTKKVDDAYYQDVDGLINGKNAKKVVDGKIINRYLSTKDDVHPNGLGYGLIANKLYDLINLKRLLR
ncbi:GDSL-type esterase/lipase family protein [Xylocopilactobacillus apicola]|uniref:Lipase/acylhydrolase n=1 Tax=Xylocopilactobacillus apicola TaxID=2932184 RepID=A0AAU9DJJ3_9LACO|nr:GDSL-type esterase/lipase family protein [Xylocopilactobacillus apicola]BDR58651.1 lipase/acylhydrolase [Xylocopilactobacillus apicola]